MQKNQKKTDVSEIEQEVIQIQEKIETSLNPNLEVPIEINKAFLIKSWTKFKKSHFGTLKNFLDYLDNVVENPFLMGKKSFKNGQKFILRLGFLLKWETYSQYIEKISFFKIWPTKPKKEEIVPKEEILISQEISVHLNHLDENLDCLSLRKEVLNKIGAESYYSWFREVKMDYGNDLKLIVKTKFHKDIIINNFLDKLRGFIAVPIVVCCNSQKK